MANGKQVLDELRQPALALRDRIPEVWGAHVRVGQAAMAEGALSTKTKELIALAIGVTRQCDGCIASHSRGAARAGATEDEVAEMLGVAIMMNGGPGTVYGPRAFDAFRGFSAGTAGAGGGDGIPSADGAGPGPVPAEGGTDEPAHEHR